MDEITALDLSAPQQQKKPTRDSFDLRSKAMDAWLENLPLANLGETSRILYEALTEVSQLQIKPKRRVEFLERLRGKVDYTVAGLRKHYTPREFPLPAKSRMVAELSMALLIEMTRGYNMVAQAGISRKARLNKNLLALAIQRTIKYSGALLVESYGIYQVTPAGVWSSLHNLYAAAERRKLHRRRVRDTELSSRNKDTIADSYKQILLLAATGPYRMRQNEAVEVYRVLERWAAFSELVPPSDSRRDQAMFRVALKEDQPPQANTREQEQSADSRLLLTDGVLKLLEREIKGKRHWWQLGRRQSSGADTELLRRLMLSLGVVPKRRFTRQAHASRVQVVIGLSQIGRHLAVEQGIEDPKQEHSAHFEGRETRQAQSETKSKREDVWELIFSSDLPKDIEFEFESGNKSEAETAQKSKPRAKQAAEPGQQNWRLVNLSAGGYCLLSDPTQSARAKIGELVAIREINGSKGEQQPDCWQTGAIRWMKHIPGEGLQLGVQVLAPNPLPIWTQVVQSGIAGKASRSLLLPELLATEQPATLVTSALHYEVGQEVSLSGLGSETAVCLTHQLESTGVFSQFKFRAAGKTTKAGFESVWSTLK